MRPIDGTRIKESLTCERSPWLDFHGPRDRILQPTERMRVLFQSGQRLEERILAGMDVESVRFEPGRFDEGFAATLDAMTRRVPAIANGVLKLGEFLGRPDLLLLSDAGVYEVADIKSTQKVHAAAQMQIAFYSRMLGQIAKPPRFGHVILRSGERWTFALDEIAASLERLLARLQTLRNRVDSDPGPHRVEACTDCRWLAVCMDDLESSDDPSLAQDVTREQKAALASAGVTTLRAASAIADTRAVADAAGLAHDLVTRFARRARAVTEGRPQFYGAVRPELATADLALAAVVDDRAKDAIVAVAGIVASRPDRFRVRWLRTREHAQPQQEFAELVRNLARTQGPLLIYGPNVRRALEEGLDLDPSLADTVEALLARTLDVRGELRRACALPGFDRRPADAARAAGLTVDDDDGIDLAALRHLEDEASADVDSIARLLRRDLDVMLALRTFVLAGTASS
ncbi:MAG: hypothetical protein JNL94_06835 [Planctomycetes bacterium]|nr:hypothetical protein [Planctomycetota bacterium]